MGRVGGAGQRKGYVMGWIQREWYCCEKCNAVGDYGAFQTRDFLITDYPVYCAHVHNEALTTCFKSREDAQDWLDKRKQPATG